MASPKLHRPRLCFSMFIRLWIVRTLPLLVLGSIVLSGAGCSLLNKQADPSQPAQPAQSAQSTLSAPRSEADILADVQQAVGSFTSAHVPVLEIQNGQVHIEGQVTSEDQQQAVIQAVEQIPGVTGVEATLTLIPQPLRAAVRMLEPYHPRNNGGVGGLAVTPEKGCNAIYYDSEYIVVDVTSPVALHQYVYADLYVADHKQVLHLFPNPEQHNNFLQGATRLRLGGDQSPIRWKVTAPFGAELLTVITSPHELLDRQQAAVEAADHYLEALRTTLPTDPSQSEIVAIHCFITTAESPEQFRPNSSHSAATSSIAPSKAPDLETALEGIENGSSFTADEESDELGVTAVEFLDTSGFDKSLSSVLQEDAPMVEVNFMAPITVNEVPERLNRWFATVEKHEGTVTVQADPDLRHPPSRFLASAVVSLGIGTYQLFTNWRLYSPAKDYNATLYYTKPKGTITKIVFTQKDREQE